MIKSDKVVHHQERLRRKKRYLNTVKRKFGTAAYKSTKHALKLCDYVAIVDRRITRWRAMIIQYGRLPY